MVNFDYFSPTKVVFGRGTQAEVGKLVKEQGARKVLLHYGGQSAQKSGLLGQVKDALRAEEIPFVELGGVVPNPHLSLVYEGIELCRKEGVDFLLAVGGGSVIDSAKAIGYGVPAAHDVWDFFEGKAQPQHCLPVGAVLTIAAAGSEMSNSSVITNEKEGKKRGLNTDLARCKFAVMNPELTLTLPAYQTACGCADILMHTMERYYSSQKTMEITDTIAEGLMRTVIRNAQILTREPDNYDARAEVMWASSLSHNGLTGCGGGRGDWSCHQLGHELSGKWDLAHGAALTAMFGAWARYVVDANPARFAQFATNVLEIEPDGDEMQTAMAGIEELESFFWGLELPTSMEEAGIELEDGVLEELADGCSRDGTRTIGDFKVLNRQDMLNIYRDAATVEE